MALTSLAHRALTAFLILLTSFLLMRVAAMPEAQISPARVQLGQAAPEEKKLPWLQEFSGEYQVSFSLSEVRSDRLALRIYPDDELLSVQINGQPLSIEEIPLQDRRSYASGFVLQLAGLHPGEVNTLDLRLHNASGPAGFNAHLASNISPLQMALSFMLLLVLAFTLLRHLPVTRGQMLLVGVSLLMSLLYLSVTSSHVRSFDVYEGGGHLDYVLHILNTGTLPEAGMGWEYHQPPLYYLIAAGAKLMAGHVQNGELWGQLLALELWVVFLMAGLASLRLCLRDSHPAMLLASLAFALWPAGIIHSIRLGNDAALYAFFGLSFFFAQRWWLRRRSADLLVASLWMSAAVISKSSGLALSALLGSMVLLDAWRAWRRNHSNGRQRLLRHTLIVGGFLLAGFAINLGDNIYAYLRGTSADWLLANVANVINAGLRVNNGPANYLVFDLATFLQQPFMSTWEDQYGRQYFWNFLLRSTLSSEFFFTGKPFTIWGIANGIFLLVALMSLCVHLLQYQAVAGYQALLRRAWRHLPWWLAACLLGGLLLAYRIKVPYSCNTDFRYIYPALLSLVYFIALPWKSPRRFPLASTLALAPAGIAAGTLVWVVLLTQS